MIPLDAWRTLLTWQVDTMIAAVYAYEWLAGGYTIAALDGTEAGDQ